MRKYLWLLLCVAALASADPLDITVNGKAHHANSHYAKNKGRGAVTLDGELMVLHADFDNAPGEFHYFVHGAGGERTEINIDQLPDVRGREHVHVEGTRTGPHRPFDPTVPEAVDPTAIVLGQGTGATTATVTAGANTGTTGAKQAAWIYVCWASPTCVLPSAVQGTKTVVDAFWVETSYGQLTMPAALFGAAMSTAKPTTCDYSSWTSEALSRAGVTQNNYRSVVFIASLPCGWRGLAYVNYNEAWTNGLTPPQVFQHEMGHNLGLLHAGSVAKPGGGVTEYGDWGSSMGNIAAMQYNAPQKNILGWINGKVVTYAGGTQTYTLSPLEVSGAVFAVKIPTPNTSRTYWLEYRLPLGVDNLPRMGTGGVLVHLSSPFQSSAGSDDTQLVQVSGTWFLGRYDDPDYPLTIALVSMSPTSAVVTVGPVPFVAPTGLRVSP